MLISIVRSFNSGKWQDWEIPATLGVIGLILLLMAIQRRHILVEDSGIVIPDKNNPFVSRLVPWSQIKRLKLMEEDTKNYLFGKNLKRGTIAIQTGNEHIDLRLVLNPKELVEEINSHITKPKE